MKYGGSSTDFNLENATDELDKQNVIIFCKPKT